MEAAPVLYLVPCWLDEAAGPSVLPAQVLDILPRLRYLVVENPKTTRRFISSLKLGIDIPSLELAELNEHSTDSDIAPLVARIREVGAAGLLSEAGVPAVADPGHTLVAACHRAGIRVVPLVGPSSLLLALMGSGLPGQRFAFQGYLPVKAEERAKVLKSLEAESARQGRTQLFIETPYRNASLWTDLLKHLSAGTRLAYARGLTGPQEEIRMQRVADWRKDSAVEWQKIPTIFLFCA